MFAIILLIFFMSVTELKSASDIKKLKENWTKFIEATLTPNMTCYKSVADYGEIKMDASDAKCDLRVDDAQRKLCIKLDPSAVACRAEVSGENVKITLKDATTFCPDPASALHMLLHSTSARLGHGATLPQAPHVPRHAFVDPLVLAAWGGGGVVPGGQPDWSAEGGVAAPAAADWPHRPAGGHLLLDTAFEPSRLGQRLLATAADPRYQADLMVQWMGATDSGRGTLTEADAMLLSQTACGKKAACGKPCRGRVDSACRCREQRLPPLPCLRASPHATDCRPGAGPNHLCPYGVVIGADLRVSRRPSCRHVTAVINGLAKSHADVKRYLEAERYPWRHFVVTVLPCAGADGRLTDVVVGFPEEYRKKLLDGRLPVDRQALCQILRVYVVNAEAQVARSHSLLTHETFCLDDLVLSPMAHLPRPRRPPPPAGGQREAVHLWLGPRPAGVSVDLGRLVVRLYAMKASMEQVTPYKRLAELSAETMKPADCVVVIKGDNITDEDMSTMPPLNFSQGAMRSARVRAVSTGSALGLLLLLALFTYCMCLRTSAVQWESESSWSSTPASWTTSSSSSWSSTPLSSDELLSSESFDFERDAHLVNDRRTLSYMRRVQEEAQLRRRAAVESTLPGRVD